MSFRACAFFSKQLLAIFLICLVIPSLKAAKYSIESDATARVEYNDNIFLTSLPHDSVYAVTIIPRAKMVIEEKHWETFLSGKLRSNNYSDDNLDSNDIYLDISANYNQQRNVYTLDGQYYKDSNLNALSTDFGIAGRRVNRILWSIAPEYQRFISERAVFGISYTHRDVDYIDAENTGFVPYNTDTASGSLTYDLTEKDQLSFYLNATDYQSKDNTLEFQVYETSIGISHKFTELWSANFTIGGSRRRSTSLILVAPGLQVPIEFSDDGYVLDAGFKRTMETGFISGKINRRNEPNSIGGLNEVDTLSFDFNQKLSARWRYTIAARYEDIDAVSDVSRTTDREVLFFEPKIFYSIDRHWTANASYRYIQREFKSDTSDSAPHSNRIYIGMTYNFPDISTF